MLDLHKSFQSSRSHLACFQVLEGSCLAMVYQVNLNLIENS